MPIFISYLDTQQTDCSPIWHKHGSLEVRVNSLSGNITWPFSIWSQPLHFKSLMSCCGHKTLLLGHTPSWWTHLFSPVTWPDWGQTLLCRITLHVNIQHIIHYACYISSMAWLDANFHFLPEYLMIFTESLFHTRVNCQWGLLIEKQQSADLQFHIKLDRCCDLITSVMLWKSSSLFYYEHIIWH